MFYWFNCTDENDSFVGFLELGILFVFVMVPFLIIIWLPQTGQIGLSYLKVLFSSKNSFWFVFLISGLLFSLSEMIFS